MNEEKEKLDPVPALCEYLRAFEKSAKKIRDAKEKQ